MPAISVLVKPASGNCNMHCDYCFYCDEIQKREQSSYGIMSLPTLKNVIKRTLMRAEGSYSIAFQGGEPTLCGLDFFREMTGFVEKYNRNKASVSYALQTNGYAIDEGWAAFLKEKGFLVGVSVDGTGPIHNAYRHGNDGGDSYAHILRTTPTCSTCGIQTFSTAVRHISASSTTIS